MAIKLTIAKMMECLPVLDYFSNLPNPSSPFFKLYGEVRLPAQVALKVALAYDQVRPVLVRYDEQRKKLLEGTKDEPGFARRGDDGELVLLGATEECPQHYEIADGEGWERAHKSLLDEEITLNISVLKHEALGNSEIPPSVLLPILWLFEAE